MNWALEDEKNFDGGMEFYMWKGGNKEGETNRRERSSVDKGSRLSFSGTISIRALTPSWW